MTVHLIVAKAEQVELDCQAPDQAPCHLDQRGWDNVVAEVAAVEAGTDSECDFGAAAA
jgi:hypothetical protein